jgi:hypothetical protein
MTDGASGTGPDGRTLGVYAGEGALLAAVRRAREHGLAIDDVYAPYAIHGLDEAMGIRRSRLALATLAGGLAGLSSAIALEVYCAVIDWPLDVGGKPANSALAFLPIAFELTILAAGLATAAAFLWRTGLRPARRAAFPGLAALGATDDRFVLVLAAGGQPAANRELLLGCGAVEVRELAAMRELAEPAR